MFTLKGALVDRVGVSQGLYSSYRVGGGSHPSVVPQYTKDHLKSIIFLTPDWPGNDTTQMILGRMMHCQRVTTPPRRDVEIKPSGYVHFPTKIHHCEGEAAVT